MKFWSWLLEFFVLGILFIGIMFIIFSLDPYITLLILLLMASYKIIDILSYFTKFIFNSIRNDDYEIMEDRK